MIYTLVDKAILLSDKNFHKENLTIVKQLLLNNDYPSKFIDCYVEKRINTLEYRIDDNNNSGNMGYDFFRNFLF